MFFYISIKVGLINDSITKLQGSREVFVDFVSRIEVNFYNAVIFGKIFKIKSSVSRIGNFVCTGDICYASSMRKFVEE